MIRINIFGKEIKNMSRVTVFMPVFNTERFIKEAVDSILGQTYKDFDLLIIDDGSTDNSFNLLKKYKDKRIRLYANEKNIGLTETRNRGFKLCDTEFIAFMDSDDIAPLERLEKEVSYLDKHPEIDGVGGYTQEIDEDGNIINKGIYPLNLNPDYIKACMIFENSFSNGSVMVRTKIIKEHQLDEMEKLPVMTDYLFYCKFLQYGKIANINEILHKYRIVKKGLTQSTLLPEKKEIRNKISDYIHNYIYNSYGFEFPEEQKAVLLKCFREDGHSDNIKELKLLYIALQNMAKQAENKRLPESSMIKTACRKQFGKQVAKSMWLWEDKKIK